MASHETIVRAGEDRQYVFRLVSDLANSTLRLKTASGVRGRLGPFLRPPLSERHRPLGGAVTRPNDLNRWILTVHLLRFLLCGSRQLREFWAVSLTRLLGVEVGGAVWYVGCDEVDEFHGPVLH